MCKYNIYELFELFSKYSLRLKILIKIYSDKNFNQTLMDAGQTENIVLFEENKKRKKTSKFSHNPTELFNIQRNRFS